MPANIKETIAEAAIKLLIDDHVKRLTVKDIVEKCSITRQAFYYHFSDIPELFEWILDKKSEQMLAEILSKGNSEDALRCFFVTAINVAPHIKRGMNSSHRSELEALLRRYTERFFGMVAERKGYFEYCSLSEVKIIYRYHSLAIFGMLQEWSDQDTRQLDQIVHTVYRLISEGIPTQIDE